MLILVPVMVSLVEKECDKAHNAITVYNNRPNPGESKSPFAVCVKGMDFPTDDLTLKLVEWIEVLKASKNISTHSISTKWQCFLKEVGANKIFLYDLAVHPNVSKLLDYYVKEGTVDLTKLYLPGPQPNSALLRHLYLHHKVTHKRQNEVIPYNDCLYRNVHRYDKIVLLDIDEIIVPLAVSLDHTCSKKCL